MSCFAKIPEEPIDPIYGLQLAIKKDLRKDKCNLSIGILQNDNGSLKQFKAVINAEHKLAAAGESKEYLPIDGLPDFRNCTKTLLLPESANSYTAQTVGGTAALYLAGTFCSKFLSKEILISNPTWVNHKKLFQSTGLTVTSYPHKASQHGIFDAQPLLDAISTQPIGSLILLQSACHNPTGVDPSFEQWKQISLAILERKLIPIFDLAYHGLGNGLAEDVLPIELFINDGHELFIASSHAKNFGIYSDRLGSITVVTNSPIDPIASQIKKIIRSTYSSPPAHGARIVATILGNRELRTLWEEELAETRTRLSLMRELLSHSLEKHKSHAYAACIKKSTGLFALLPLQLEKIVAFRNEGVYLSDDGRITLGAITERNVEKIAAILAK